MLGWVLPFGESVVAFTVMSDDGDVLRSRAMSIHAAGVQDWDGILQALGYKRTGRWLPTGRGFWCYVAESEAQRSAHAQG